MSKTTNKLLNELTDTKIKISNSNTSEVELIPRLDGKKSKTFYGLKANF